MTSLMLFHRDLRAVDNTALLKAIEASDKVLCVFIFTPEQIDPKQNKYYSEASVQFMCESLLDLKQSLQSRLLLCKGDTIEVLKTLYKKYKYTGLYQNKDVSLYSIERDARIKKFCDNLNITFVNTEDYDLVNETEGLTSDGKPYTNLSQYFARFQKDLKVRKPNTIKIDTTKIISVPRSQLIPYTANPDIVQKGGRTHALQILAHSFISKFKQYSVERDYPAKDGTTKLSAYIKFGCVSIREVYHAIAKSLSPTHALIRELVFRSFYIKIFTFDPELQRGKAYITALDSKIPWKGVENKEWELWTTGNTGYPMCDAGMRQLQKEGWVHNRVRMILASVATRYLLIDWRHASRYFYSKLVDADTFSNTAGWQWAAGVGPDAAPYFRAPFNPFIQSKKFDNNAEYIKKYIPELKDIPSKDIHKWNDSDVRERYPNCTYPAPVIEQKLASKRSIDLYKTAAGK